jgi:homoserine O-acetyltransferase
VLTEAMNSHDLGRDRGGVGAALRAFEGQLHVAGVTTDRLYPLRLTEEIAALRPGTGLSVVESRHGHDGFLVETAQVGTVIESVLSAG